jgi:hypothetical protein
MKVFTYTNRYEDQFTFIKNDDGDILWEGNFEHCRFGYPNDYKRAYQAYCKDASDFGFEKIHIEEFKQLVHESVYDGQGNYLHAGPIQMQYGKLVESITSRFNMVDPSGGPFIKEHMDLGTIMPGLKGLCVASIEPVATGFLIYTYGAYDHLADNKIIGGIINTTD